MTPPSMCIAAVVLATACSRTGRTHRPGDEWLSDIVIEGNRKLGDKELTTGLALRRTQTRGRAPDPYVVDTDAERIRGEYVRRGYLDADVRSRVERDGDASTVIYTIDEGVRATTKVVIRGVPPSLGPKVRAAIPIADGAPFDYATYEQAKDELHTIVENAGYPHVKLVTQVVADRARNVAVIRIDYEPGPKAAFGEVEITGVGGELREAIENRVAFAPGQIYSTSALAQTQRSIHAMNRFSTVRVQPEKNGARVVGVKIEVVEGARHAVELGGGFGIDPASYEVRARGGYSVSGWPTPIDTALVDIRPAYALVRDTHDLEPRLRALAKIERQDILWTLAKGEVETGFDFNVFEAWSSWGPRGRIGLSTPLVSDRVHLAAGWFISRSDFTNINQAIDEQLRLQIGLEEPARVGAYTQSLVIDVRDNVLEPRYGVYAELRVAEGTRFAGGAFEYVELVPDLRGYLPIGPVVLAARVRSGTFLGDVPPTERFFSGGGSSQRGFSERRLSPSVFELANDKLRSIPYGGGALIESSLEARVPIMTIKGMPIGAVAFLDGGDVTETLEELDLGFLHWAVGAGVRVKTVVGPIRFDVGYRLNRKGLREPEPESSFAFHLAVGESY